MKVVVLAASPRKDGKTQHVMRAVDAFCKNEDAVETVFINLAEGGFDYYEGTAPKSTKTQNAVSDLLSADAWILGVPVYNSFFSSALKNLLEFIDYKKTGGKTCGLVFVGAGSISFTQVQNATIALMTYFRIITNPQTVFVLSENVGDGGELKGDMADRLKGMVKSTVSITNAVR